MFIQSKTHIDHLVTALIHAELITSTPDETGRMLWRENLTSLAYRYPGDQDGQRPGPAGFRDADVESYTWTETPLLTGAALHGAVLGYVCQSCAHPEWDDSAAGALMDELWAPVRHLDPSPSHWAL